MHESAAASAKKVQHARATKLNSGSSQFRLYFEICSTSNCQTLYYWYRGPPKTAVLIVHPRLHHRHRHFFDTQGNSTAFAALALLSDLSVTLPRLPPSVLPRLFEFQRLHFSVEFVQVAVFRGPESEKAAAVCWVRLVYPATRLLRPSVRHKGNAFVFFFTKIPHFVCDM
jgi:hypothetical protein